MILRLYRLLSANAPITHFKAFSAAFEYKDDKVIYPWAKCLKTLKNDLIFD